MLRALGTDACPEESFNFRGRLVSLTSFLSRCTKVADPDHPSKTLVPKPSLQNKRHAIQNIPQLP